MRTGAAGVLVGWRRHSHHRDVLGIGIPQATALADVRAARMRHLDETGVYVHVIADGPHDTGGDDRQGRRLRRRRRVLGPPLAAATEAPAGGTWWGQTPATRSWRVAAVARRSRSAPSRRSSWGRRDDDHGRTNLFGGLRPPWP